MNWSASPTEGKFILLFVWAIIVLTSCFVHSGAECTVAFNDAWDRAETRERDAVLRHRSLLRRWVNQHKKSGSR